MLLDGVAFPQQFCRVFRAVTANANQKRDTGTGHSTRIECASGIAEIAGGNAQAPREKGRSVSAAALRIVSPFGRRQLWSPPPSDDPEPHDGAGLGAGLGVAQFDAGAGSGAGAGAGAGLGAAAFLGALFLGALLVAAFFADFFGAAFFAFLADFFAAFFADFLADFFEDFLADFFFAITDFLAFLAFLLFLLFFALAIVILLLPLIRVRRALRIVRLERPIDQFNPGGRGKSFSMMFQVAARSGHDQPENMPSAMQDITGVQEITQAFIGLDAAEEQKRTRLVSRNIIVGACPAEYPVRDHVDPPCNACVQFFEFGSHPGSVNYHPACLTAEPCNDFPFPSMPGKPPGVLDRIVYRNNDWNAFAKREKCPSTEHRMNLLDVQYLRGEIPENPVY